MGASSAQIRASGSACVRGGLVTGREGIVGAVGYVALIDSTTTGASGRLVRVFAGRLGLAAACRSAGFTLGECVVPFALAVR